MPEVSKPNVIVKYSCDDVTALVQQNLSQVFGFDVSAKDIVPVLSGGYKDCDCYSWGGPRVGECHCPYVPSKFEGYRIEVKQ